jgi:hypothetical protein
VRFEYKVLKFDKSTFWGALDLPVLEQQLNELGREGWEVVSMAPTGLHRLAKGMAVVLKRSR